MNIELLSVGTRPPDWIASGFSEYQKRLPRDWKFEVREIAVARRRKGEPVAKLKADEGKRMMSHLTPGSRVVALDKDGQAWTTEKLANNLSNWSRDHSKVQLLVGGPDGLSEECMAAASDKWSLSKLTFPHFIVRLLLAEQIYRAWSVLNNHPYHK